METSFNLDDKSNESFYKHLLNIWEITPAVVKEKFLRQQKCSLCKECYVHLSEVQAFVKADKLAKLTMVENKD
jgi:hypothetical protein